jgi:hypothetical protein
MWFALSGLFLIACPEFAASQRLLFCDYTSLIVKRRRRIGAFFNYFYFLESMTVKIFVAKFCCNSASDSIFL